MQGAKLSKKICANNGKVWEQIYFLQREDGYCLCVFFGHFEKSIEKFNHVQFHHNFRISGNRKTKQALGHAFLEK